MIKAVDSISLVSLFPLNSGSFKYGHFSCKIIILYISKEISICSKSQAAPLAGNASFVPFPETLLSFVVTPLPPLPVLLQRSVLVASVRALLVCSSYKYLDLATVSLAHCRQLLKLI